MTGPPPLALIEAAQILCPPTDALDRLGQDRAGELTLEPGEVVLAGDRIAGFEADSSCARVPCAGCALVPGFVDCHTHLPFAGWRAEEYAMKVAGVSYADVSRAGGGILSSARALAAASDDQVLSQSGELAAEMLRHGTTTLETKSGYGLSVEGELRALGLADALAERVAQGTTSTALLAHAVPPGFTAAGWMDEVEGLVARAVTETRAAALDIFVESIAFGNADLERMGRLARQHGLALRAHVEQLSTQGSVPVALAAGARSVDHLSRMPPEHVGLLAAAAECTAVLLPGAEFLGGEHTPPARELADAGATCALATDANPGTSPILSLPLIVGLAVRRYRWTIREALLAITLNAAWVLGRSAETGSLEVGKQADLLVLDGPVEHIPYRLGHNPVAGVIRAGRVAWVRPDHSWRFESVPSELRP